MIVRIIAETELYVTCKSFCGKLTLPRSASGRTKGQETMFFSAAHHRIKLLKGGVQT